MQATTEGHDLTGAKPGSAPRHLTLVQGEHAPAPAEAATDLGFEFERAPRRRRLAPLKALQAWYLRWLLRTLRAEHKRIDWDLTETTNTVVEMARHGQVCPWWPARRRELQERRALYENRIAEVVGDLVKLGQWA